MQLPKYLESVYFKKVDFCQCQDETFQMKIPESFSLLIQTQERTLNVKYGLGNTSQPIFF